MASTLEVFIANQCRSHVSASLEKTNASDDLIEGKKNEKKKTTTKGSISARGGRLICIM